MLQQCMNQRRAMVGGELHLDGVVVWVEAVGDEHVVGVREAALPAVRIAQLRTREP